MQKTLTFRGSAVAAGAVLVAGAAVMTSSAEPAQARECFTKAGVGTATTLKGAKFQVDEVLLQATDWGAWAEWMATGKTSGYDFGPRKYKCKKGGLGYECRGQAKLCKK